MARNLVFRLSKVHLMIIICVMMCVCARQMSGLEGIIFKYPLHINKHKPNLSTLPWRRVEKERKEKGHKVAVLSPTLSTSQETERKCY